MASPVFIFLVALVKRCPTKLCSCKVVKRKARALSRIMHYQFYVRILFEEYINLFLICLINMMRQERFDSSGEDLSFTCSLFVFILLITVPILIGRRLFKPHPDIEAKYKRAIGPLYSDLNTKKATSFLYIILYASRRVSFCLTALFGQEHPYLQVVLFQAFCLT